MCGYAEQGRQRTNAQHACSWRWRSSPYTQVGTWTITLTTTWTGRYRLAGTTTWQPVAGTATTTTTAPPFTAVEAHARLVADHCHTNPTSPGC